MTFPGMGWNARWDDSARAFAAEGWVVGRVVRHDGAQYQVVTEQGTQAAVLPGRWRQDESIDLPAVGDWVALSLHADLARVEALLPRASWIVREEAGTRTAAQVVAANVDVGLVVTDAGADFNPRRIERYVAALEAGRVTPLIVINKVDEAADRGPNWMALERAAPGVVAVMISARTGEGMDDLLRYLPAGTTAACVGSSGVGKSTLINRLLGHDAQATGATREHDGRGRHTTTHRELLALANGAWIIDTPGLRELVPWFDGGEQTAGFADIAALASSCRFRNCGHTDEPGCAVLAAVASGALDGARLANLHRLQREAAFQASRRDDVAARERKRAERQFGRVIRDIEKHNPKRR